MTGVVSLVGAGPGDPDLLTVKATRRLAHADVVFHDALVRPEVLALAGSARLVDVGKRARRRSNTQASIERRLIDAARRDQRVVRLKGGDPFVFGRGGEEALALSRAGVPFEVIPGLSSAVAAPTLSGIPLTHRGLTSAFLVVSGHSPDTFRPVLGALAPGSATLVVLMGLSLRREIARALLGRGWRPDTPAATILRASTPEASTELDELQRWRERRAPVTGGPGILIVGQVVSLAENLKTAFALPHFRGEPARDEKGIAV